MEFLSLVNNAKPKRIFGKLRTETLILIGISLIFFFIYLSTAPQTVFDNDSGELSAVVQTMGLAHSTGFPLYVISSKLFSLIIPVGDIAYRLNIFSALLSAISVGLIFFLLRYLNIALLPSISSSFIFGFGSSVWSNAGVARVYSLTMLIAIILFLLFIKWEKTKNKKIIYLYSLVLGLGAGTHFLIILMAIPLIFMLIRSRFLDAKAILLFFLPLVQYIYLPIAYSRHSIATFGRVDSVLTFINYMTQREYSLKFGSRPLGLSLNSILTFIINEYTVVLFIIALIGFYFFKKSKPRLYTIGLVIILSNIVILSLYGDIEDSPGLYRYLFISFVVIIIAIAHALDRITKKISNKKIIPIISIIVILLSAVPLKMNFAINNRRNNSIILDYNQNILKSVEDNAILITKGDTVTGPLWYLQSIGQKSNVIVIDENLITREWYRMELKKRFKEIPDDLPYGNNWEALSKIIDANFDKHPVYMTSRNLHLDKTFLNNYKVVTWGIVNKLVRENYNDYRYLKEINDKLWDSYALVNLGPYYYKQSYFTDLHAQNYGKNLINLAYNYTNGGLYDDAKLLLLKAKSIHPAVKESAEKNLVLLEQIQNRRK